MNESISDEELKTKAPKTRDLAIFIKKELDWLDNLVLVPSKDRLLITFDIKIQNKDKFTLEDPMFLQMRFVEETRPFREKKICDISRLFFIPQNGKFVCFVQDEQFIPNFKNNQQ